MDTAYLRVESNGCVHELEGEIWHWEMNQYADSMDGYDRGGMLHSFPGPVRTDTEISWRRVKYNRSKIPKPLPTDMPDVGEFFD